MKHTDAIKNATHEIDTQIATQTNQINANYNAKVLAINNEAALRGLLSSTVVLQQLDAALLDKQTALANLTLGRDAKIQVLAQRMISANATAQRTAMASDRDSWNRMKAGGVTDIQKQKALDEEMYAEYFAFLIAKPKSEALTYVSNVGGEYSIFDNLSPTYVTKLQNAINGRLA